MPTTVTMKIGNTGSPVSVDYSTLTGWEADAPSNLTATRSNTTQAGSTSSTIVLDASASGTNDFYKGHAVWCDARSSEKRLITAYNGTTKVATIGKLNGSSTTWANTPGTEAYTIDSVIWEGQIYNQGEFTISNAVLLTISGVTTSSSCYVSLKCASGASFRDNANVRTNALDYNSSNGVALRSTYQYSWVLQIDVAFTKVDGLQIYANSPSNNTIGILLSSNIGSNAVTISNCVIKAKGVAFSHGYGGASNFNCYNCLLLSTNAGPTKSDNGSTICTFIGCTAIQTGGTASSSYVLANYGSSTIKNCAGFGGNAFKSGSQSATGSSGYNATDQGTAFGSTGNLTSLTFANQFVSTTNDFRAVGTGSLDGSATPDATNTPTDISNTTRDATAPTIGCWEVVATATQIFKSTVVSQAVKRAAFYYKEQEEDSPYPNQSRSRSCYILSRMDRCKRPLHLLRYRRAHPSKQCCKLSLST